MKTGFHRWSSDDQRNVSDDELDGLDERKVGVVIDEQRGFRGLVSFEVALPLIPTNYALNLKNTSNYKLHVHDWVGIGNDISWSFWSFLSAWDQSIFFLEIHHATSSWFNFKFSFHHSNCNSFCESRMVSLLKCSYFF